ncbi:DUF3397 family protein [Bacillus horti]|uniref:Energy-coupling factor transporter transmembrane protein EcfT n=1 Tax=Caldalkalibacillus horti TaxID=77523 RepID=A0ABT9VVE1_9BACI|nr:DUF3397 family protein [Bacillus horti]MDQ0164595.1 energy-coupling factor transporter transmembrane protein EcfT [Bacillus horti]
MLVNIFAQLVATLALFPLLSFILVYILLFLSTRSKEKALQWAISISTILIIISISITIKQLWGVSLQWLLFVIILLIGSALTYLQFTLHGQINYYKLTKGIIRLSFLLFVPVHIFLYIWVVIRAAFISVQ